MIASVRIRLASLGWAAWLASLAATIALGAPPRNDGDWQLQDLRESATAVWVSGSRPAGCAGEALDTTTYVVRARVFIDTVRVEAENTRRSRLYLVGSLR